MNYKSISPRLPLVILAIFIIRFSYSQDKVYLNSGRMVEGKVTEIGPKQIKMTVSSRVNGPVYIYNLKYVDSILYADGSHEDLRGMPGRRDMHQNIPQLNTWTFDQLGFAFLSVSQSYERRLKSGLVGFRVPLYIGFLGGGIAGVGLFTPGDGVSPTYSNLGERGFSIATGLNPKFYLFKHRAARAFIGPEATIGYSKTYNYNYDNGYSNYNATLIRTGTVAALAKFGITFNPTDRFTMTLDGGVGIGDIFGYTVPATYYYYGPVTGLVGVWHIGFAIGTNF